MEISGNFLTKWLDKVVDAVIAYKKTFISGTILMVAVLVSFFFFRYYRYRIQVAAHQDFVKVLEMIKAPVLASASKTSDRMMFASEQDKWQAIEQECTKGYEQNSSSGLAPMFQIVRSDALLHLDKHDEAVRIGQQALSMLKSPELKAFYGLKQVLMQLDSNHENSRHEGLEALKKMAFDRHNLAHDQALYHLGLYFWINKQFEEARGHWQQFVMTYGNEQALAPLVEEVKEKLKLIAV